MEEKIIAQRIKEIRTEQELTLEEVANKAGLTKGLLSKMENNKVSPPISTLVKVAKALGVSLSDFFSAADTMQIKIVRKEERRKYKAENQPAGYTTESLISGFFHQKMEPIIVTIEKNNDYQKEFFSHPGQEMVCILEGTMKYLYDGEEYLLSAGDTLYFNAENTHGPLPIPGKKVKYLSILCP